MLMIIFSLALFTEIIYVGYDPDDDYETIQEGIDAAAQNDTVSVGDGWYYGGIEINSSIHLISEGGWENCTITTMYEARGITVHWATNTEIEGFRFRQCYPNENEDCSDVGGAILIWIGQEVMIKGCMFEDNKALHSSGAIYVYEGDIDVIIKDCMFINNFFEQTYNNSVIYAHAIGWNADYPYIDPEIHLIIDENLFVNNQNESCPEAVINISDSSYNLDVTISNNTFDDCYQGISLEYLSGILETNNCIFSDIEFSAVPDNDNNSNTEYCAFYNVGNSSIVGDGCIFDEYPLYCDLYGYEYWLLEGSPCIDTGDPDEFDDDGTQRDMGCYPTIIDMKLSRGEHWNYISCPRLPDNYGTLARTVFGNLIPLVDLTLLHKTDVFTYDENTGLWNPYDYEIQSWKCYKFYPKTGGTYHLPLPGSRLAANHVITLNAGEDNWIGYYIPYTQDIDEAFYDTSGFNRWDDIYSIKAENWTYLDMSYPRDGGEPKPSMKIRPLHYGKGYIVRVKESFDLVWNNNAPTGVGEKDNGPDTVFYTFLDKPDYEVIDVMDIEEGIQEIGVFENGICVGAVVVDETAEQILVYSDQMNREGFELTFEIYEGRGRSCRIDNYFVFDEKSGRYIEGTIIGGNQEYSTVILGELLEPGEQEIENIVLHQNYPNPFKPNTSISYNIPNDETINWKFIT